MNWNSILLFTYNFSLLLILNLRILFSSVGLLVVLLLMIASILVLLSLLVVTSKSHVLLLSVGLFFLIISTRRTDLIKKVFGMHRVVLPLCLIGVSWPLLILRLWRNILKLLIDHVVVHVVIFVFSLSHGLSLVEEVFSILHEIHLFYEQIGLFLAEALICEELRGRLLELIIRSLDLFDVDLLFLIHLAKPIVHDLLLIWLHGSKRVEEIPRPHDLRVHDDLVDEMVGVGDQSTVVDLRLVVATFSH